MLRKILVFVFMFAFVVACAQAEIRMVPDPYTSIQAAVNAAYPGDTIYVTEPGDYAGAVITKRLELYGCEEAYITSGVQVPGPSGDPYPWEVAFYIPFGGESHGSKISHFTINCFDGNNIGLPVVAHFANDITVSHLMITNPVRGINNGGGKGWTITHNTISGLTQPPPPDYVTPTAGILMYGIDLAVIPWAEGANDSLIAFNKITADATGYYACSGIMSVTDSDNPGTIIGNKIVHNTVNITGTGGFLPVSGISLSCWWLSPDLVAGNLVGFNDCRGMEYGIYLIPPGLDVNNTFSRNLTDISENRRITGEPPEDVSAFNPIIPAPIIP